MSFEVPKLEDKIIQEKPEQKIELVKSQKQIEWENKQK